MEDAAPAADEDRLSGAPPRFPEVGPAGPVGLASHRMRCAGAPCLDPLARRARERSEALAPPKAAPRVLDGDVNADLHSPASARGAAAAYVLSVAMFAVVLALSLSLDLCCPGTKCRALSSPLDL